MASIEDIAVTGADFVAFGQKPKTCECKSCGAVFVTLSALADHYSKVHSGNLDLGISKDDQVLYSNDLLAAFIPCPYETCGRLFQNLTKLSLHHNKVHKIPVTKKQKYFLSKKYGCGHKCSACKKSFTLKSELQKHMSKVHKMELYNKCT